MANAVQAPESDVALLDIPAERVPRHVAIIMDGNGRWAVQRGIQRVNGHVEGAKRVKKLIEECTRLRKNGRGPDYLTLYSFSLENWKRPIDEVSFLMEMYIDYLRTERPLMMEKSIRFQQLGRIDDLPEPVQQEVYKTQDETSKNKGMTLSLAVNYGSRAEIVEGVRKIAARVARGELTAEQIDEKIISASLYTAGMPDPDLLIRTAGEMRVSNYLLWQISYAELYVSEALWPDFDEAGFHKALRAYAARNRRFGGLDKSNTLR